MVFWGVAMKTLYIVIACKVSEQWVKKYSKKPLRIKELAGMKFELVGGWLEKNA